MKQKYILLPLCITVIAVLLYACHSTPDVTESIANSTETAKHTEMQDVFETEIHETNELMLQEILTNMTLEQKVAQLFIVVPESLTGSTPATQADSLLEQAYQKYPVGGFIYMAPNIENPTQLSEMTSSIQKYSIDNLGIPIFQAVDEEGGSVARIASNPKFSVKTFDSMQSIGQTEDLSKAYEVGASIGSYLSEYGLNFDFAPVLDVLSNPDNQVVKTRAFGSDPQLVSDMTQKVTEGLISQKIQYSLKHFPGHGSTLGDTHDGFAFTDKTLDELMACELIPFADAITKGADCVMVGHISVPKVIGDNTPSSLSKVMITDVLRHRLNFNGVVITDALNMKAIQEEYTSGEAAVKSFLAGTDLLLMPADFKSAYNAMLTAVTDHTISEERLNESVLRILKLKYKFESD